MVDIFAFEFFTALVLDATTSFEIDTLDTAAADWTRSTNPPPMAN